MTIRKATLADIPQMMEIFAIARKFMAETGNPNQWAEDYPSVEQLTDDINSGDSYVFVDADRVVATFLLRGGDDPTYDIIYDGAWKNNNPYATIHRIASNGKVKGIFRMAMEYALQHYSTIRIDTHRDNKVMQHVIEKAGFEYCGIIHCRNRRQTERPPSLYCRGAKEEDRKVNGDERLAYQYD